VVIALGTAIPQQLAEAETTKEKVCHHEPTGECTETHLGVAPPKPGATECTSRSDCAYDEFCGAGVCRTIDGETATLCIDRLWLEGFACEPVESIELTLRKVGGADWGESRLAHVELDVAPGQECAVQEPRACEMVDLEVLARNFLLFEKRYDVAGYSDLHMTSEVVSGHQQILNWLDTPCRELTYQRGDGSGLSLVGEVSLWYP
jgi:hypothetical protein